MSSQTGVGIARRVRAGVSCRHPSNIDGTPEVVWSQSGCMTANDPSQQQEAANHGDAELPGKSDRSNTRPRHRRFRRLRPEGGRAGVV